MGLQTAPNATRRRRAVHDVAKDSLLKDNMVQKKKDRSSSISSDATIHPPRKYAGLIISVVLSVFAALLASGGPVDVFTPADPAEETSKQCNGRGLFDMVL